MAPSLSEPAPNSIFIAHATFEEKCLELMSHCYCLADFDQNFVKLGAMPPRPPIFNTIYEYSPKSAQKVKYTSQCETDLRHYFSKPPKFKKETFQDSLIHCQNSETQEHIWAHARVE